MKELQFILKASTVEQLFGKERSCLSANPAAETVFKRYFLEDRSQKSFLPVEPGAISYIVQPPLGKFHIALWLYMVEGADSIEKSPAPDTNRSGQESGLSFTICRAGGVRHIWTAGGVASGSDSESQTRNILDVYERFLTSEGLSIERNCMRTWFFCHDIDNNYSGFVKARWENFAVNGLTIDTHYIASTGICGTPVAEGALVQMDAYAVDGDVPLKYLQATTHLNPTYEYGVTFERGVKFVCSGNAHCLVSGTASIDNRGAVLYKGDVKAQTLRMLENIEKLLEDGACGMADLTMALIYLRNSSDYGLVAPLFASRFPGLPYVILEAPVCRPEWLIEMECIAMSAGAAL
ncbi:MAG: Rid family hydrolase [Bacteroidales bacterium]|nr:Rid family hydrolase [Bacteroidales bacterium]